MGRTIFSMLCVVLTYVAAGTPTISGRSTSDDTMGEHYEAAQKALAAGDVAQAGVEYKRFISEALRRLARRRAAGGDLGKSIELLEEGLELTPNDIDLQLDYAGACRSSGNLAKAKAAAQNALTLEPKNAKAHLELGRILSTMGEDTAATSHFERAVALDPNFENGYALAKEYLKRKDPEQASKIFAEMQTSGDLPELHMEFGSAYAEAGYPERGIPEFEKALAKNEKIRGGHYSLGAAYLLGLGNVMQGQAEGEFQKELKNYPDDPLSLYQLGSIEFGRHELDAAEGNLNKASKQDARNPDIYLLLGQIYNERGRAAEAEAALRQSIALTSDVTRNNYQVQRAHYLLARLLLQSGRREEAKPEMKAADELLKQSTVATQGLAAERDSTHVAETRMSTTPLNPENMKEADAFEQRIKAAVADSYNNLAVMSASVNNFPAALRDFREAAKWNPSLEGLDNNWGRAAFSARDYEQAVGPLTRYLRGHPDDTWIRAALGSSYFSLQKYREAVETLHPLEDLLGDRPQLSYIFAVSQVKGGEADAGMQRLEALEKANPDVALIPDALAEAYANRGENEKAAREREISKAIQSKQTGATLTPKPN